MVLKYYIGNNQKQHKLKKISEVINGTIGNDDQDYNKEHKVSLTAYSIGETELTKELYNLVMKNQQQESETSRQKHPGITA